MAKRKPKQTGKSVGSKTRLGRRAWVQNGKTGERFHVPVEDAVMGVELPQGGGNVRIEVRRFLKNDEPFLLLHVGMFRMFLVRPVGPGEIAITVEDEAPETS